MLVLACSMLQHPFLEGTRHSLSLSLSLSLSFFHSQVVPYGLHIPLDSTLNLPRNRTKIQGRALYVSNLFSRSWSFRYLQIIETIPERVEVVRLFKGAAHLWGLFFHHFFSFRNFYFTISSFLHYVVWLLKYKRNFFWKILVTPRWVMAGRMVNNFFLVGTISHVWMIGNSKSIFILKEGMNGYRLYQNCENSFINKQIVNFLFYFFHFSPCFST